MNSENDRVHKLYRTRVVGEPDRPEKKTEKQSSRMSIHDQGLYSLMAEKGGPVIDSTDRALHELRKDWSKLVGPILAKHSRATYLDRGKLTVRAEKSAYTQELHFYVKRMEEKLKEIYGPSRAGKIKVVFEVGPMDSDTKTKEEASRADSGSQNAEILTNSQTREQKKEKPLDDFILGLRDRRKTHSE